MWWLEGIQEILHRLKKGTDQAVRLRAEPEPAQGKRYTAIIMKAEHALQTLQELLLQAGLKNILLPNQAAAGLRPTGRRDALQPVPDTRGAIIQILTVPALQIIPVQSEDPLQAAVPPPQAAHHRGGAAHRAALPAVHQEVMKGAAEAEAVN